MGGASCKASPERGGAHQQRAEGFVPPTLAGRGGSVSRRDHSPAYRRHAHLSGGTKPEETSQPKRQPLFGREGSGGRGASLREAASPPRVPFRIQRWQVAAALSAAATIAQLIGDTPTAQAEPSQKKRPTRTPAALRERGVWGERGFSQRSRLSPQNLPVSLANFTIPTDIQLPGCPAFCRFP